MVIPDITPFQPILLSPTAIAMANPFGCLHAPDNCSRLHITGQRISQRTRFMLHHAYDLYAGVMHIHAVAVGDRELSTSAREQLSGRYGYSRGFNGLPQKSGNPVASANGELIICPWMLELGHQDLRSQ